MPLRPLVALAAVLVGLSISARARAEQEARLIGDQAFVEVRRSGACSVEHVVTWRVLRGPFRSFDLRGVGPGIGPPLTASVATQDGLPTSAHAVLADDSTVRVKVGEARGVSRGLLVFHVRWEQGLVGSGLLAPNPAGLGWTLRWLMPAAANGYDLGTATLTFPSGDAAPRLVTSDLSGADDGADATLVRREDRDVLQLIRPHVAQGESVAWTVAVDRHALSGLSMPSARSPSPTGTLTAVLTGAWSTGLLLTALGAAYGWLVARAGCASSAERSGGQRGLVPLAPTTRGLLAGGLAAAGIERQLCGAESAGAVLVALTLVAAAIRAPIAGIETAVPGRWLPLRAEEAFARAWRRVGPTAPRAGARAWVPEIGALLAVLVCGVTVLRERSALLKLADGCLLLPPLLAMWVTKRAPVRLGGWRSWLSAVFRRLSRARSIHAVPWGRIGSTGAVEELRILALPRAAMPGLMGIEIALVRCVAPSGVGPTPAVLVRVRDQSEAARRLAGLGLGAAAGPGRNPEERLACLFPRLPSKAATVALAHTLVDVFAERRARSSQRAGPHPERRLVAPVDLSPTCLR